MRGRDGDELPSAAGGVQVGAGDVPHVHRIVGELASFVEIPMPHIWVLDDPVPQAMATGSSPEQAAVTVSVGLLQLVDRRELRATLAHEVGHVRLGHIATGTAVATRLARRDGLVSVAGFGGGWLAGSVFDVGVSETVAGSVAGMAAGMMSGRQSRRQFAEHVRRSETEADLFAAEVGGSPGALSSALQRIQVALLRHPSGMAAWRRAVSIVEPNDALATHPPIEERRIALAAAGQGRAERSCLVCWFPEGERAARCRRCGSQIMKEECSNCEAAVDPADRVCGRCGALRALVLCWWCDGEIEVNDRFCTSCGCAQ